MRSEFLGQRTTALVLCFLLSASWVAPAEAESFPAGMPVQVSSLTISGGCEIPSIVNLVDEGQASFALQIGALYAFHLDLHPELIPATSMEPTRISDAMLWLRDFETAEFTPNWAASEIEVIGVVPEPATLALLASGLTVLAFANRRLRRPLRSTAVTRAK
jgi:hypothetical protein